MPGSNAKPAGARQQQLGGTERKAQGGGGGGSAKAAIPRGGLKIGEADLRKGLLGLKYNTLDVEMTVKECLANAGKECADIKRLSHTALATGRDQMLRGNLKAANSSFAFAYTK